MLNYRTLFIEWYHEVFKNHELYHDMEEVKEDSPWHRESSVSVHTDMVVSQYLCRSPFTWNKQHLCGALACAFHDTGKPAVLQWKESEERGKYKVFYQHEQVSARMWEDYIMFWKGRLGNGIELNNIDVYRVGWMIQNHLPWGVKKPQKVLNLIKTMKPFSEAFFNVLLADQHGRISDNAEEKMQRVDEWIHRMIDIDRNYVPEPVYEDKKIYVLIGASGSGKSSYVNRYIRENNISNYSVFSFDKLVLEWYLTDEEKKNLTFESYSTAYARKGEDEDFFTKAQAEFMRQLKPGLVENFFIDNTNTSTKNRRFFVEEGRKHGYAIIGVLFQNDLNTLEYRTKDRQDKHIPLKVVNAQYNATNLPGLGEVDRIEFANLLY